jgi:pimeloyl-ACP methyl ester carboxylesterase
MPPMKASSSQGVTMPYATNNGVRIHYQVEGEGPPLVLHHGSFASGSDWRDLGYAGALRQYNQLILIDARGHGESDRPHDPSAYDMASRVSDVTSVLDALQIQRAHFFGYSMGGYIGFGLAKHAADRFRSLILGGAHPYAESLQGFREALSGGMANFISMLKQAYGPFMTPAMLERHQKNDLRALLALCQDWPDISDVLPTMTMPCLLFVGEADPRLPGVRDTLRSIPGAAFFSLPECGHAAAAGRHDLVLPHITAFLSAHK